MHWLATIASTTAQPQSMGRFLFLLAVLLGVLVGFVTAALLISRSRSRRARRRKAKPGPTDMSVDPWTESGKRTPFPDDESLDEEHT